MHDLTLGTNGNHFRFKGREKNKIKKIKILSFFISILFSFLIISFVHFFILSGLLSESIRPVHGDSWLRH